jgi:hypothetical protein
MYRQTRSSFPFFTTTTRPGVALGFFIFKGGFSTMVDFNQKAARKFCRYTRCRTKLAEPTTNLHEAFCKRGCYDSFHLKLCRVCEKPLEQKYRKVKPKTEGAAVKFVKVDNPGPTCGTAKCKRAWRDKTAMGRYSVPKAQIPPSGYQGKPKITPTPRSARAAARFE